MTDLSVWYLFANASWVVKFVMLVLVAASVLSWTIIFQYRQQLKQSRESMEKFTRQFWSGVDLNQLYAQVNDRKQYALGLSYVFHQGFQEFLKSWKQTNRNQTSVISNVQRALRKAMTKEEARLEGHLPVLATIGSTSPYIGLFGTVWGIMVSFHALGGAQQVTIAMVAPGISEALIATAMGLFAAIPAVIAYNRYSNQAERLLSEYDSFVEEFTNLLQRQLHASKTSET